jgi:hypothetical protein
MLSLDEHLVFLDRRITTKVSFAVALTDEYTDRPPIGSTRVFIKEQEIRAVKNHSGYFVFLNLSMGEYKVRVESEYYFGEEVIVKTSNLEPLNPIVSVTLKPMPFYPFASGATLIRGMVQDSEGVSISGAKLEVIGKEVNGKTTNKGEFVLFFKSLSEEDIIEEGGKKFVKGNVDKTIHLKATYNLKTGTTDLKELEEGQTTPLESPIVIN